MLTTGSSSRVVEVMKTSLAELRSAGSSGFSAMAISGTRISSSSTARVTPPAVRRRRAAGSRRGCRYSADEDVGGGAFGDFAALVEQDDFVETLLVRSFIARQILGPGEYIWFPQIRWRHGGHWEQRRASRCLGQRTMSTVKATTSKSRMTAGTFIEAAAIAHDHDAQGGVQRRPVGFDQALEPLTRAIPVSPGREPACARRRAASAPSGARRRTSRRRKPAGWRKRPSRRAIPPAPPRG